MYLYPPGGPAIGGIGYRERVQPLRRARDILDELIARYPDLEAVSVGPIERLLTLEGEYAAAVTVATRQAGLPAQRDLGLVFGDDFCAEVSGLCFDPASFDLFRRTVRELVLRDEQMLGVRRRRFLHDPPPGWEPCVRGFQTDWFPPDYPKRPAVISVLPAVPRRPGVTPAEVMESLVEADRQAGAVIEYLSQPEVAVTPHRLQGQAWEMITRFRGAARSFRDIVIFADDLYVYHLRLELLGGDTAMRVAAREVFAAVVRSSWPLPRHDVPPVDLAAAAAWSD